MASDFRAIRKQLAELTKLVGNNEAVLFKDFASKHLSEKQKSTSLRASSVRFFVNQITNHLIPAFGHLPITGVTSEVFNSWVDVVRRGEWNKTRRPLTRFFNTRKCLMEVLLAAYAEGLLDREPEIENPDERRDTGRWVNDMEMIAILFRSKRPYRFFFFTLWRTGCRPGEVARWQWDMLRWHDDSISIDIPARIVKTGRDRTIPINSDVCKFFTIRRAREPAAKLIFHRLHLVNDPLPAYGYAWDSACARAEVAKCVPYDTRRSLVSHWARIGVTIDYAAHLIDSSATVLRKYYMKFDQDHLRKAAG